MFKKSMQFNSALIKPIAGCLLSVISTGAIAIDLTTPDAEKELQNRLGEGVTHNVIQEGIDTQRVILNGQTSVQALRKALYSVPQRSFLKPSATITVSGQFKKDHVVKVILESNIATGYSWGLDTTQSGSVIQKGAHLYESRGLLGGKVKQTIHVAAPQNGHAAVHLVYQRAWQSNDRTIQSAASSNKITLNLDGEVPDEIDLSDPNASSQTVPQDKAADTHRSLSSATVSAAALPTAFDWRDHTGVTAIRDQGQCGSCWAFATAGALESAVKIKTGADFNASEQFLVSCNTYRYNCDDGGRFDAHDFHMNTPGLLQQVGGAGLETDMPYTATNGSCQTLSQHPQRLASWSYVTSGNTIPSVDQIKNAIYTNGPVAAAVCVGNAFLDYTTGVFNTNEAAACGGSNTANHAIMLVGWDDATQSWVLRNSWSTRWGEQGYMRIKYNTSNVGLGANSVVIAASNGGPASQTITALAFSPSTLVVGGTSVLSATASSGLPVTFISNTLPVCTVTGNTVKGIAAGACLITANQIGNASYTAAAPVNGRVIVNSAGASQTITALTFSPTTLTVGGTATLNAKASSGLTVTFISNHPSICTVNGNTVTGVSVGACTITANQIGNASYTPAAPVNGSIVVSSPAVNQAIVMVIKAGTGSGRVTSSPSGIDCGNTCSGKFNFNTTINFSVAAESGSVFAGGVNQGCAGTPVTCKLLVTFNKKVAVKGAPVESVFTLPTPLLMTTPAALNLH